MVGRAAYDDPFFLAAADREVFGDGDDEVVSTPSRREVVEAMVPYTERAVAAGESLHHLARHMLGLFAGRPGARAWRRHLTEAARGPEAGPSVLLEAAALVPDEVLDERPAPAGSIERAEQADEAEGRRDPARAADGGAA
jgi:tRNA-dihydrouridine synthase A